MGIAGSVNWMLLAFWADLYNIYERRLRKTPRLRDFRSPKVDLREMRDKHDSAQPASFKSALLA